MANNPYLEALNMSGGLSFGQEESLYPEQGSNTSYDLRSDTQKKQDKIDAKAAAKNRELRKDERNYGNDSYVTRKAKDVWNYFASHDNQLAANVEGKRYNTQNKIFNDETDLSDVWGAQGEDPNGDKVLYYLRKRDGINPDGTDRFLYKTGIADNGASDRYAGQLDSGEWDLIAEKRFNAASTVEKQIHGSQAARDARAFDYGTYDYGDSGVDQAQQNNRAYSDFGAGTSELYDSDILGLDTGNANQYAQNKAVSDAAMNAKYNDPYQRNDTFEFIDAFQAAGQTLVGKGVKAAGSMANAVFDPDMTGDGAVEAWGKKLMEDANKDWGYNDKSLKNASAQMRAGFREGNPLDFLSGLAKAIPQSVAGSIPEMAAYAGAPGVKLAGKIAALSIANTNDALDIREEANGGKKATAEEIAAVAAGQGFASLLDAGAFRFVSKLGEPLMISRNGKVRGALVDEIKDIPDATKFEMAKALGGSLKRAAGAGATEATQETTTEAIRLLTESLNTDKYGESAYDIIMSEAGQGRLANAAALGSAGGVGFNAPSNAVTTAINANKVRNRASSEELQANTGANVENKEVAEQAKQTLEVDFANVQDDYNSLNEELKTVDKTESKDELLSYMAETSLDPVYKKQLTEYAEKNPKVSMRRLRSIARDLMNKQLDDYVEGAKGIKNTGKSIDEALADPMLENAEPTNEDIEEQTKTEEAKTQFEKEYSDPEIDHMGNLLKQGKNQSDKEYAKSLNEANDYLATTDMGEAQVAESKAIDEKLKTVNAKIPAETEFNKDFPENWEKDSNDKVFQNVDKLVSKEPKEEDIEGYVEEIKQAKNFILKKSANNPKTAKELVSVLDERVAEITKPEVKEDVVLDETGYIGNSKKQVNSYTKGQIANNKAVGGSLTELETALNKLENAKNVLNSKRDIKNKKTGKALNSGVGQINAAIANTKRRIEAKEKAEIDTQNKIIDAENSKVISKQDKEIDEYMQKSTELNTEIKNTEIATETATGADKLIANTKLKNLKKAKEALGKIPKKITHANLRQNKINVNKKTQERQAKDKKRINTEIKEATKKANDIKEAQSKEDNLRIDFEGAKSPADIKTDMDTLAKEIEVLVNKAASLEEGNELTKTERDSLDAKLEVYKANKDKATDPEYAKDYTTYQKLLEGDAKRQTENDAKEAKNKADKAAKSQEAKQENARLKASEILKLVDAISSHTGVDFSKKIEEADKKEKKVLVKEAKALFQKAIKRTGSNTLKLMHDPTFTAEMTSKLGLTHEELTNEVRTAQINRERSNNTLGIGKKDFGVFDPETEFVSIMQPVHEAKALLTDESKELTDQETKDAQNVVLDARVETSNLIQNMSRAQFEKFKKDGQLTKLDAKLNFNELGKLLGYKEEGAFEKLMNDAVDARNESEQTNLSKRKYVAEVSRAKTAYYQEDINLAKDMIPEMVKDGILTEKQGETFSKMLDDVMVRSKDRQKEIQREQEKAQAKVIDEIAKDMPIENKARFDKLNPHLKLQLAAITDINGNFIEDVNMSKINVDRENSKTVTMSYNC